MRFTRRAFVVHAAATGLAAKAAGKVVSVRTVEGPIPLSQLGFTLSHEHICACIPEFWRQWPEGFHGRAGFVGRAVEQLKALKGQGVDTLVDLSTYDGGRDIRLIEEVSRKSGLQIVVCTGQHLFAPPDKADRGTDALTEFFIGEIERGIDGTDIRAGIIKVATATDVITAPEERALRAAARASRATGIRIATHTHARLRAGEKQAAILEDEGISPARVSLGHSDDSGDFDYLEKLARRGYTLGMDHVNRGLEADARVPWKTRAEIIRKLIDAGLGDRMVLSQDVVLGTAMLPVEFQGEREKNNPDGMSFTLRGLIPYLEEIGVPAKAIRALTVDNPRRFFGGA